MKLDDFVIDDYAPKIGAVAFAVYIIYVYKKGKIGLKEVADRLGLTLPTVLKARNTLLDHRLILRSKKSRHIGKFELIEYDHPKAKPLASVKNIDRILSSIYQAIIKHILSHPRYKHIKATVLSKKIRDGLKNLVVHHIDTDVRIEKMCEWWLTRKKHLRFSFGLFCCDSIVDEFKQTCNSLFKSSSGESKIEKIDNGELLNEVAHDIMAKIKRGEKLDADEEEILRKFKRK